MTLLLSAAESELSAEALALVAQQAQEVQGRREREIEAAAASPFAPRVVAWRLPERDYLLGLLGKM